MVYRKIAILLKKIKMARQYIDIFNAI